MKAERIATTHQARRNSSAFLLFPLVILLMAAPGSTAPSGCGNDSPRSQKIRLQLKWRHQYQFAGYYMALEKGFYRDNDLEVELKDIESARDVDAVKEVLRGNAEFGIASSDLVVHRVHGRPVVALAALYQHSPLVLIARKDSGVSSIHDLEGKSVIIEQHAEDILAYLRLENVTVASMQRHHPFSPAPLVEGTVDAMSGYVTDEPYALKERGIDSVVFSPRAGGIDFYADVLFTTESQIVNNPIRVRKFREASLRGWRYALENPAETINVILDKYGGRHSREHLEFEARRMKALVMPDVVEPGYMYIGRWTHIANTYAELGMIEKGFSLNGFLYGDPQRKWSDSVFAVATGVAFTAIIAVFATVCGLLSRLGARRRKLREPRQ